MRAASRPAAAYSLIGVCTICRSWSSSSLLEEMRVVDAADLVVLDAAAMLAQRVAIPADALDRDRMVDVVGDVEEVVALLRRPLEALGRHQAGDPDRRMRLLVDRRQQRHAGHRRPEIALELHRRAGPGLLDQLDALLDPLAALLHVDAENVELVADEAAADAEIEPALRQLVERRRLLGHPHRIVERQHGRAGAEPDALGARREIGEERVVGREQPAVPHEMVLDDPGVVDADPVGEFDLLDDAAIVRLRVAHRRQIGRQIEQPEFHRRVSFIAHGWQAR